MNKIKEKAAETLEKIRRQKPLIHHITNMVVMNDTANVTLHLGALPVMAHAKEEVEEMVSLSSALILNPGTLTPEWIESMFIAGKKANKLNIPIIQDPVGAGATKLRTQQNLKLLKKLHIAILRGNSGEIGALAGAGGKVKGVESVEGLTNPLKTASTLARRYRLVLAITGKQDIVSDGKRILLVDNGHQLLSCLTGTGCMATTVIACFAAVEKDYLLSTAAALACFGLAAELAAKSKKVNGPASFKVALFDELFNLTPAKLATGLKINQSTV